MHFEISLSVSTSPSSFGRLYGAYRKQGRHSEGSGERQLPKAREWKALRQPISIRYKDEAISNPLDRIADQCTRYFSGAFHPEHLPSNLFFLFASTIPLNGSLCRPQYQRWITTETFSNRTNRHPYPLSSVVSTSLLHSISFGLNPDLSLKLQTENSPDKRNSGLIYTMANRRKGRRMV